MANPQSPWRAVSLVSVIGTNFAVGTVLGVWLGKKVDSYLNVAPWGMIGGLFMGMAVGVLISVPIIKKVLGESNHA